MSDSSRSPSPSLSDNMAPPFLVPKPGYRKLPSSARTQTPSTPAVNVKPPITSSGNVIMPAQIPNNPVNPSRGIADLPEELLVWISSFLDYPTASSLLTTAKRYSTAAESRFWRDLDVTLPDHYGEHPLIRPFAYNTHQYCDWAQAEARRAEDRARRALNLKAESYILNGSRRRFGNVRKITLENRSGSASMMVTILSLVAPRLEELTIKPPLEHIWDSDWIPTYLETIYGKLHHIDDLVTSKLQALKKLNITFCRSDEYLHSLLCLLSLTHGIESLAVNLPGLLAEKIPGTHRDSYNVDLSHLRELSIKSLLSLQAFPSILVDHIKRADLETASFSRLKDSYHPDIHDLRIFPLFASLGKMKNVKKLIWTLTSLISVRDYCRDANADVNAQLQEADDYDGSNNPDEPFASLDKLVVFDREQPAAKSARLEGLAIPAMPNLKDLSVCFSRDQETPRIDYSLAMSSSLSVFPFPGIPIEAHGLPPILANTLREKAPQLRLVQFTQQSDETIEELGEWEVRNITGCVIRSFVPDDDTPEAEQDSLIHIRTRSAAILRDMYEKEYRDGEVDVYDETYSIRTFDEEMTGLDKGLDFVITEDVEWTDMTDYKGHVVPLSIISKMQRFSEYSQDIWSGRSIYVDENGWEVLEEWYESQNLPKKDEKSDGIVESNSQPEV